MPKSPSPHTIETTASTAIVSKLLLTSLMMEMCRTSADAPGHLTTIEEPVLKAIDDAEFGPCGALTEDLFKSLVLDEAEAVFTAIRAELGIPRALKHRR